MLWLELFSFLPSVLACLILLQVQTFCRLTCQARSLRRETQFWPWLFRHLQVLIQHRYKICSKPFCLAWAVRLAFVTFKYQLNFQNLLRCWLCTQAGFLGLKMKASPNVFHSVTGHLSGLLFLCSQSYWKAYATCRWIFSLVILCQALYQISFPL